MWAKTLILLASLCIAHCSIVKIRGLDDDPNSLVELELEEPKLQACELYCTSFGFSSGVIIDEGCACNPLEDTLDNTSLNEENIYRTRCKVRKCIRYCQKVGLTGGVCVEGGNLQKCGCDPPPGR